MKTIIIEEPFNLKVVRFELDFTTLDPPSPRYKGKSKEIKIPKVNYNRRPSIIPTPPPVKSSQKKRDVKELVEELLDELYANQRDWSNNSVNEYSHGSTQAASTSSQSVTEENTDAIERNYLESLDIDELRNHLSEYTNRLQATGERLAKWLKIKDRLRRQQKRLCAAFTILLRHISGESGARFGVTPGNEGPGEGGYAEWLHAMRLVARLPAGVPHHFRRKLWLNLAERHLTARGIEWSSAERACFRGTALPDDAELGAQILKDLHRTGCSLFCGAEGRENQAMLRRVLLAYARWNKEVGYCQGFNMLAAIILEVMEKSEADSLKVMIYLVEAVLPEGYFADDLRGLSADMAAFRDLLRLRLPRLARHMDHLQRISDGGGIEPPLPDVFTMQWFLTLYATWLPRESLLRIWDLILLDGNEVLLLTALAIWDMLQDRILSARSADEFYSCMGGGAGAVWEAGEALVARVVAFGSAPELPRLRNIHRYRVTPPAPVAPPSYHPPIQSAMQSMTKRGLRLFYSEDEGDSSDDGNKMALATVMPQREERSEAGDRLSLDIGALKRQYARLRERQRQAHVILAAACARHAAVGVPTSPTSLTVNNLLLGKSAIVSSRGRRLGPPPGAIPPSRQTNERQVNEKPDSQVRSTSNETISWEEEKSRKSLNRRNSVKWKDIKKEKALEIARKPSIDLDERGDGIIVSELEANEMIASIRSRSSSESSSYSSHTASSTDTSLCDENEKASDSEAELPDDDKENKSGKHNKKKSSPIKKEPKKLRSPIVNVPPTNKSPERQAHLSTTERSVKDISDYLDSAAGEPLRAYIDGFETKLKHNELTSTEKFKPISPFKSPSSQTPRPNSDLTSTPRLQEYLETPKHESKRPNNLSQAKKFTDLSPIDLSPCPFVVSPKKTYEYEYFESNFKQASSSGIDLSSRPPDIIDSFTMYPNFVPDIDLSDKNVSDFESPPRSPGSESIIVSEDEPPIPLKIDKYFEHSPEFFGARLTDPNNADIPNRRATKRNSRLPKKPDSLTLQSSHNEKISNDEAERASSLPQSHSFTKKKSPSPVSKEKPLKQSDKSYSKIYAESPIVDKKIHAVSPIAENKLHAISPIVDSKLHAASPTVDSKLHAASPTVDSKIHAVSPIIVPTKAKITPNKDTKMSPKDHIIQSGRKNSERALQIIQENSQILSRILTKQNISNVSTLSNQSEEMRNNDSFTDKKQHIFCDKTTGKTIESKLIESPLLKESTSDSLIGYIKRKPKDETTEKNDFLRARPISIDDPFSFESRNALIRNEEFSLKNIKTPSSECLANKTDIYGWENKGFLAKCEYKGNLDRPSMKFDEEFKRRTSNVSISSDISEKDKKPLPGDWPRYSFSGASKGSVTSEMKDTSTFERRFTSDDYNYPFSVSSKYNDFILTKASDICSKIVDEGPKISDISLKAEISSRDSDFSHVVTSSISFTCDPSAEDDSPIGAKSNSSDTLCQITSLDQISTPISPKVFPNRETPTLPKDYAERSDRMKLESDDTCSAITSLIETDTLSSLSYPRSPSSGSYHPFPTRPAMRMPKDIGVRLGMYPKESLNSPSK
ncbi:uncharacterized protein [Epargyreus clarus]|uniref:uncharacterized protein n=1 Tax=Epargyreus clarus TaxID=520877 RepID=UPI003C2EEFEB